MLTGALVASLLITIAVGFVIPWLVALVTKETLPAAAKALVLLLLSTIAGVLVTLETSPPTTWAQWQQVLLSIFVAFVAAVSSDHGLWKPTGTTPAISRASSRFGLGR